MAFPVFAPGDVLTAADMNAVAGFVTKAPTTFTTVGTINADNVFSTDYQTHVVEIRVTAASTTLSVNMRMRASGTDASGSNYYMGMNSPNFAADTTIYGARVNAASSWAITTTTSRNDRRISLVFYRAPDAANTTVSGNYNQPDDVVVHYIAGSHTVGTAYDGFTILTSTGTITGTYSVTGYR
jgi:hypothetical protein